MSSRSYRDAEAAQVIFSSDLSGYLIDKALACGLNLAYSPLSIHSLLNFLISGTTGLTHYQLRQFLRIPTPYIHSPICSNFLLRNGQPFGGPRLLDQSGIWLDVSSSIANLRSSFVELANSVYNMVAYALPLSIVPEEWRNVMNNWVAQGTAGRIDTLFLPNSVNHNTRLLLSNAVLFCGKWDANFRPWTTNENFRLLDGTLVASAFMVSTQRQFISAYDGFRVLRLQYERGQDWRSFSFYIFLPDEVDGLQALSVRLQTEPGFLNNHMPQIMVPVGDFRIPKFRISASLRFAEYLTDMGLYLPFMMTGDFCRMIDSPEANQFYLSEIAHACCVEVNEESCYVAAAPGAPVLAAAPGAAIDFVADHPFVFMIPEDASGVVLFSGHLLNPLI